MVGASTELGNYFSVDISRDGMRLFRLVGTGPSTDVFAITIPLAGAHRRIHALAETVRIERRGALEEVALRFRYLAPEDQRTLDCYLATRGQ
jgi:hypothetical protein